VGPFQFTGEYMNIWLQRPKASGRDLFFHGGYIYVAYFLTGEHIPWNRQLGILGRVRPFEEFFALRTCRDWKRLGFGAWQVAALLALAGAILSALEPADQTVTREVAWAVYEWVATHTTHDGVFGDASSPYRDVTSGIWQTILGGWGWGASFRDWAYQPQELIQTRTGICVEQAWLATALLRALNIPARTRSGSLELWAQTPDGSGVWVGMAPNAGANSWRQHGVLGPGFGNAQEPAFVSVTSEPLLHEDWDSGGKLVWRERHPWSERYPATAQGLADAESALDQVAATGSAPASGFQPGLGEDWYEVHYAELELDLHAADPSRLIDVRFPLVAASAAHTSLERHALWVNHAECPVRSWISELTNPPVPGSERWLHIELDPGPLFPGASAVRYPSGRRQEAGGS
jgi:hypothetical protein